MSPPTILIIEPDRTIAQVLTLTLESTLPVQIVLAEEPDQVLQFMREHAPKLVLISVTTRTFNAFDVVVQLKRDPSTRDVPVILFGPRGHQIEIATALGCREWLTLPFRAFELVSKVLKYVEVVPKVPLTDSASPLVPFSTRTG